MGLCPRRDRGGRCRLRNAGAKSPHWCRRASAAMCRRGIPALRYAIALNDRGYFWESQEILETVWAAAPQGGRERILLRACILIANANLRLRMQKPHAAARLLGRGARRTQGAGAQRGCRRRRLCRRLSERTPGGAAGGQTGAAAARQDRLGRLRGRQPDMKQNACLWRFRLDLLQNMHYCAYKLTG